MSSKRLPKWKMPIVSKTCYLLCFNHILPLHRPPKICTISYKMRISIPCTYFDPQKWLQAFGVRPVAHFGSSWSPPLAPKDLPKGHQKASKISPKSVLQPEGSHGLPQTAQKSKINQNRVQNQVLQTLPRPTLENTFPIRKKARWRSARLRC